MVNLEGVNLCPPPLFDPKLFGNSGDVQGRLCQRVTDDLTCCLPCPMADWLYPDSFITMAVVADWVALASALCCVFLLVSWAALPVDKTRRHYLSVCFTLGVLLMNLGFVIPLAAQPDQCFDTITPHNMYTSKVCGASGSLLLLGGWCGVMWAFLRSFSLHLQICWQVIVGRKFMMFAQAVGWGIPILGIILALVFSGVSFRFGATCHINHNNSLAILWAPLLLFAGATVIITFATFGYCVKVYLASLNDTSSSTEGSGLPSYANSLRTLSPRQAYYRVQRVIALQWRGIAIVLIIIGDVIFFSIVFVFQDRIVQSVTENPWVAKDWVLCLIGAQGDKKQCLKEASSLAVNQATVSAVLSLLALNGIWLLLLLGRWTMFTEWVELVRSRTSRRKKEFISVDARYDIKEEAHSYEMLSKDSGAVVAPLPAVRSPWTGRGVLPGYSEFGQPVEDEIPAPLYSRHPQQMVPGRDKKVNPLGLNSV